MRSSRVFFHTLVLFLLPLAAVVFDWSVFSTLLVLIMMLAWRWLISLMAIAKPERVPELQLDSISISHFVEKVRWNMDLMGVDYVEQASGGTLGAFFLGRTVPRLRFRTGAVRSEIGNSSEILRYLWGRYGAELGDRAAHLEPTPERVDFEGRIDSYGVSLQVWCYAHILPDRELTLRAWGIDNPEIAAWQRSALKILYPVLATLITRSFRISSTNVAKSRERIEKLLEDVDTALADGRQSILGGDKLNYTDYAFAGMSGVWLQPEHYGGGKAEHVSLERDRLPNAMRADIDRWTEDYSRAVQFVSALYRSRVVSETL